MDLPCLGIYPDGGGEGQGTGGDRTGAGEHGRGAPEGNENGGGRAPAQNGGGIPGKSGVLPGQRRAGQLCKLLF